MPEHLSGLVTWGTACVRRGVRDESVFILSTSRLAKIVVHDASALTTAPMKYSDYLWVIAACGLAVALLVVVSIVVLVVLRRKDAKKAKGVTAGEPCPVQREQCRINQGAVSRDYSLGWFKSPGQTGSLGLSQRASSSDAMPGVSTEPVQPTARSTFVRWNTFCASSPEFSRAERMLTEAASYRFSDEEEDNPRPSTHGRLWFSVLYRDETEELDVTVIKAKYLPGRGLTNAPRDPFVRVYLLPDEDRFGQTKTKKRTLSPRYDETTTFKINLLEARQRTLRLSVYDLDRKKIRHCLGHVSLPLERTDLITNEVIEMDLENVPKKTSKVGEMQVCLTCNPFSSRVKVTSLKLRKLAVQQGASVYIKISLDHGRNVVKEKQTSARPSTSDIVTFNEVFSFGIAGRYLESCSLCFTVMLSSDAANDIKLGRTALGPFMYARGDEHRHWQEMLSNPRSPITKWHALDPPEVED